MDKIFILNPSINTMDIQDAIHTRLIKVRGIVACLMAGNDEIAELHKRFLYGAVCAVDDYLEEIENLQDRLEKIAN